MDEVEKLLEKYCSWCTANGGDCQAQLDGCAISDALALLRAKPKAGLIAEIKEIIAMIPHITNLDYLANEKPSPCTQADKNCPRCLLEAAISKHWLSMEPPVGELSKRIRAYLAGNVRTTGYDALYVFGGLLEEAATLLDTSNEKLKEVCETVKIRIHFIGLPSEPMNTDGPDWSKEIKLIEQALKDVS